MGRVVWAFSAPPLLVCLALLQYRLFVWYNLHAHPWRRLLPQNAEVAEVTKELGDSEKDVVKV